MNLHLYHVTGIGKTIWIMSKPIRMHIKNQYGNWGNYSKWCDLVLRVTMYFLFFFSVWFSLSTSLASLNIFLGYALLQCQLVLSQKKVLVGYWVLCLNLNSFCSTDLKFCSCSDDTTVKIWDFARCQEERSLSGNVPQAVYYKKLADSSIISNGFAAYLWSYARGI